MSHTEGNQAGDPARMSRDTRGANLQREEAARPTRTEGETTVVNKLEAASLLLDAWKFRQAHCWASLQRYYLAAALVSAVPYILTDDQRQLLSGWLWAFPVLGGILGLAAVWHYGAEYIRCEPLTKAVRKLLEQLHLTEPATSEGWRGLFLKPHIGWMTVGLLAPVTIALSITNLYLVTKR